MTTGSRLRDLRITFSCPGRTIANAKRLVELDMLRRAPNGSRLAEPNWLDVSEYENLSDINALFNTWETYDGEVRPMPFVAWSGRRYGWTNAFRCWSSFLSSDKGWLKIGNQAIPVAISDILGILRLVDFDVAGVAPLRQEHQPKEPQWPDTVNGASRRSFSEGHYIHGFAAAFRGDVGHKRLVSRRWLEHGPWRVIRDEALDISFVQFHEIDAPMGLDAEQAWPGHHRMGLDEDGGYTSPNHAIRLFKPSFYDPDTRTSIVIVPAGRAVSHDEMLEAAAVRANQPYPDLVIDQVAFVFANEADARLHLHDLWLRGLEVRAITPTGEVRLDDDYYADPPPKPDWVAREQARDGLG